MAGVLCCPKITKTIDSESGTWVIQAGLIPEEKRQAIYYICKDRNIDDATSPANRVAIFIR